MRPHFIIVLLFCTLISALDLNLEDIEIEHDVGAEKILEKRQLPLIAAELINDIAGSRYVCPTNYELHGSECHKVDCIFENTDTQMVCNIPATPIYTDCGAGYAFNGRECMRIVTETVCPQGTVRVGDECIFRVPGRTVYVDFRCPAGSVKDVVNKICILTAQIQTVSVQCPVGYQRVGNVCYYQANLSIRCPDGTPPINNVCTIQVPRGGISVNCPANSRLIGNNICELIPPQITVRCADGNQPDMLNRCHMKYTGNVTVTRQCPSNTISRNGKCYIEAQIKYPLPVVTYFCPVGFKTVGNQCIMDLHTMIKPEFMCPQNYTREGDACVFRIDDHRNYDVRVKCPDNSFAVHGKGCQLKYTGEMGTCERIYENPKCCKKRTCNSVATRIHNVNHVYIPTNITSTNIATINIGQGSSCGEKGSCKTSESSEEEVVKPFNEKCCTVVTPRVCENNNGDWDCGHREYERCGSMCVQDTIHLKASRPMYHGQMLVMPPPQYGMRVNRRQEERVNCFGCLNGRYDCSPECFEYDCAHEGCNLMEQNTFCGNYGGAGCAAADGYFPY